MVTLPEIETQIKIVCHGPELQELPEEHPGAIVFRITARGVSSVEILTDQSDEEDTLRQRLTLARPILEELRGMFTLPQFTNQESR